MLDVRQQHSNSCCYKIYKCDNSVALDALQGLWGPTQGYTACWGQSGGKQVVSACLAAHRWEQCNSVQQSIMCCLSIGIEQKLPVETMDKEPSACTPDCQASKCSMCAVKIC